MLKSVPGSTGGNNQIEGENEAATNAEAKEHEGKDYEKVSVKPLLSHKDQQRVQIKNSYASQMALRDRADEVVVKKEREIEPPPRFF